MDTHTDARLRRNKLSNLGESNSAGVTYDDALRHPTLQHPTPPFECNISYSNASISEPYLGNLIDPLSALGNSNFLNCQPPEIRSGDLVLNSTCFAGPGCDCFCKDCLGTSPLLHAEQSHVAAQNGFLTASPLFSATKYSVNTNPPAAQFTPSNTQEFTLVGDFLSSPSQPQALSSSIFPSGHSTSSQLFSSLRQATSQSSIGFATENPSGYDSIQSANMRHRPNTNASTVYPHKTTPTSSKSLGSRIGNRALPLSAAGDSQYPLVPWLPSWTPEQFLKAKSHIVAELQPSGSMTDPEKGRLAQYLTISVEELDMVMHVIKVLEPILENLKSASKALKMPEKLVTAWYSDLQTGTPAKPETKNSGNRSKAASSKDLTPRAKRQKKSPAPDLYQCTHISPDRTFCPQTSKDQTDWKRHEEKHYPQKKWKCMLPSQDDSKLCYQKEKQVFLRKDKLINHFKTHGTTPPDIIDAWHDKILSDWKRQCGFCGYICSDWDSRCVHVGKHFRKGKRMDPDWKDPWTAEKGSFQNDSDDDDDNGDDDGDDDHDDNDGDYEDEDYEDLKDTREYSTLGKRRTRNRSSNNDPKSSWYSSRPSKSSTSNDCESTDIDQRMSTEITQQTQMIASSNSIRCRNKIPRAERRKYPFEFVRSIGRGAFGFVDEVLHRPSNTLFARKTIQVKFHSRSATSENVLKEIIALRSLTHQHIVQIMASYVSQDQRSIIMSPIADCNLYEFLNKSSLHNSSQRILISKWFRCLAAALSFMHEKGWLHMDLKPQNLLVHGECIFISDLGSARSTIDSVSDMPKSRYAITPMYCAPEVSEGLVVSWASDIFSLGCIFLEMATTLHRQSLSDFLRLRQSSSGDCSFKNNIRQCRFWIDHLSEISADIGPLSNDYQVISKMLSLDMQRRPSAQVLKSLYKDEDQADTSLSLLAAFRGDYFLVNEIQTPLKSASMAFSWLNKCENTHKHCSIRDPSFFPTRILYVGGNDITTVRLQAGVEPSHCRYVALSHCWEHTKPLTTTNCNLRERSIAIQCSSLPQIFQHAVQITRALEISYLWIDSLCIIQDSQQDWTKESSQMHKIYSNSSITIAATLYADHDLSILSNQSSDRKALTSKPEPRCTCSPGTCKAFKPLLRDNPGTTLLDSPLSQRGWALQERMLSPRVLHFSATRLVWECREASTTIDATSRMRKSIFSMHVGNAHRLPQTECAKAVKETDTTKLLRNETIQSQNPPAFRTGNFWRELVREYSKRCLSKPQDKLPAVAGIATTLYALNGCRYLAGLWDDDLHHNLLWSRGFAAPPTARPSSYRAPSWSWAAIDSQVVWHKSVMEIPVDNRATILECTTTPCSSTSPFGGVKNGHLRIRGPMQKAAIKYPQKGRLLEGSSLEYFAFVHLDARPTRNIRNSTVEYLWCLEVLAGVGLVLKEMRTSDCGIDEANVTMEQKKFERVGVFWTSVENNDKGSEKGCWKETTVCIV
ncbi:hypothetical protein BP5796_00906 [Coleophoma crateriformis]|uniref:Protein kinase domain-containing protein n=1 Tax=Coleophoma crateriformis TaxID=565419 RepID=A0A3D8T9A4_9HELO|nr:hypothetical protein BP5796_00906 [Coleophoma crateriformis]